MSNVIELFTLSGLFDILSSSLLFADAAPQAAKGWVNFILHFDRELKDLITRFGLWTHLILFLIIFCETGLVVMPFLPGDSLLFAAGALAADQSLKIEWLIPLLIAAAILGDTVNYALGYWIGERAFSGRIPFIKKAHLDKTHAYFEKYGGKTIIIARFVPIVRTFAPFVAGVGSMSYWTFILYNIIGGVVWVLLCLGAGYVFGRMEFVKNNFELVVLAIIVISVMPIAWEWWSHRSQKKSTLKDQTPTA